MKPRIHIHDKLGQKILIISSLISKLYKRIAPLEYFWDFNGSELAKAKFHSINSWDHFKSLKSENAQDVTIFPLRISPCSFTNPA